MQSQSTTSRPSHSDQLVVGYVERVTFYNPDNGFTVAKIKVRGRQELACLVGPMPAVQPGETVRCQGKWVNHPSHGWQFHVTSASVEAPAGVLGIQKYLESGLIKGIGPVYAKRIVEKFGEETLTVIDRDIDRLKEIPGLGLKRLKQIAACWDAQKVIREVMIFLQSYGVSPAFAQRIFKTYQQRSIEVVRQDPYCLAREIFGIGFKSADKIATALGIAHDDPKRVEAGIEYVLSNLSDEGHVCSPQEELITAACQTLEVDAPLVEQCIARLIEANRIVSEPPLLWRKSLYLAEKGIAQELHRLNSHRSALRSIDTDKALAWVQEQLHISLATNQKEGVAQAVSAKVMVLTGGPGTGKSTITKAILAITTHLTRKIMLAAPTGRAAKRMSEICRRQAKTIHALLEWDFKAGGFKKNHDSPLDCDLIVIDEASMIDTPLMNSLLRAIPSRARLILVGDIDQLPSVGPGNVLMDIIDSKTVAVTQLTEIFRQARGSRIVVNAHRINQGEFPSLKNDPKGDFFFIEANEPEEVQNKILDLVASRLPHKYQFDPVNQIQVLAPMKRGPIGTGQLNTLLQNKLNPNGAALTRFGTEYRAGDKVMQIRNNYDKNVYNGDVGGIDQIDSIEQNLVVNFDGRLVGYDFSDLDELLLAYAVSIHKYQGSECPCVVMPVHTSHFKLLCRNLLYTGITRGKKLVVLVGSKKALAIAVRNDEVLQRHTGLKSFLQRHPVA